MNKLSYFLPSSSLLTGKFSKKEIEVEQALLNKEGTWIGEALQCKSTALMVFKVAGIIALYIATGFLAMAIDFSNIASQKDAHNSLQEKRLYTIRKAAIRVLVVGKIAFIAYGISKLLSTYIVPHIQTPDVGTPDVGTPDVGTSRIGTSNVSAVLDERVHREVNVAVKENLFVKNGGDIVAPSEIDLLKKIEVVEAPTTNEEEGAGFLIATLLVVGGLFMSYMCLGGSSKEERSEIVLDEPKINLSAELSNVYDRLSSTKPDKSGVTIEQQMAMFEEIERVGNNESSVATFSNGSTLYLGPMSAIAPETFSFVVVHGRQEEVPCFPHERLKTGGVDVHFFDRELNSMDIEVRLSRSYEISESQAHNIALDLMSTLSEAVKTGHIGIKSEDIKLPFSEENLERVLMNAIRSQRSIRFYANIPHEDKNLTGIVHAQVQQAINKETRNSNIVQKCIALKDCDSEFFAGDQGKDRIQQSILYIIRQLKSWAERFSVLSSRKR